MSESAKVVKDDIPEHPSNTNCNNKNTSNDPNDSDVTDGATAQFLQTMCATLATDMTTIRDAASTAPAVGSRLSVDAAIKIAKLIFKPSGSTQSIELLLHLTTLLEKDALPADLEYGRPIMNILRCGVGLSLEEPASDIAKALNVFVVEIDRDDGAERAVGGRTTNEQRRAFVVLMEAVARWCDAGSGSANDPGLSCIVDDDGSPAAKRRRIE